MQLLAKFKKILYMGFRATLNFRKFKVALNLSGNNEPSKSTSWKVLETVLSHLKFIFQFRPHKITPTLLTKLWQ